MHIQHGARKHHDLVSIHARGRHDGASTKITTITSWPGQLIAVYLKTRTECGTAPCPDFHVSDIWLIRYTRPSSGIAVLRIKTKRAMRFAYAQACSVTSSTITADSGQCRFRFDSTVQFSSAFRQSRIAAFNLSGQFFCTE